MPPGANAPYTLGNLVPAQGTGAIGSQQQQAFQQLLQQKQMYDEAAAKPRRFPTAEQIQQRITETELLLDCLKEVIALLEAHPQLERLVGALGKLQQL